MLRLAPILLVLIAGAVLAGIAFRAPAPTYQAPADSSPEVVPIAITTVPAAGFAIRAYRVEGMCCEGCAGKLHDKLVQVAGVEEAAVDNVLGRAEVLVRADADDAPILAGLRFDKYTAEPLP